MSTPTACKSLQAQHNELTKQIAIRNKMLVQGHTGPNPGKPDPEILGEKQQLVKELGVVDSKFDKCRIDHPHSSDNTTFVGMVTLTIQDPNPQIKGPFHLNASIGLTFDKWHDDAFFVTSFPPIKVGPFSVPSGTDTITVSVVNPGGQGSLNRVTNALSLSLPLHFHHSFWAAGDSNITFALSTANPGGAIVDGTGNVAVAGTAVFMSGFLGGDKATVVVKGKLTPAP